MRLPAVHIRGKILALVGGVLAFSGVSSTLLIEARGRRLLRERVLATAVETAQALAADVSEPVLTDDRFRTRELVEKCQAGHSDLRYVFVLGPGGEVLASSFDRGHGVPEEVLTANRPRGDGGPRVQPLATEQGTIHDVAVWILGGGGGMVRLGVGESSVRAVTDRATRLTFVVQAGALAAALAVAFVLAGVLVAPVRRLGAATRRVARGDLDSEVEVATGDEIGELGAAWNRMLRDLRHLRDELVESRDAAMDILRNLAEALVVVDPGGRVVAVNPATEELTGLGDAELTGLPVDEILVSEGAKGALAALLSRDGITSSYDLCIRTRGDERRPVSFRSAPMRGRDGRLRGFIITLRDLSQLRLGLDRTRQEKDDLERRVAELGRLADHRANEIEQIKTHLVRSDRLVSLGQLGAGIAHEINNPLASILTYTKVLERELRDALGQPSDRMAKALRVIEGEITRCSEIVRRFLDYSRMGRLEAGPIRVDEVVGEVFALVEPQARVQKIALARADAGTPLCAVGDAAQLRQVLLNVVINALQASPSTVTIAAGLADDGAWIEVRVADDGAGIPAENLPRVFDPFFTTKKPGEGTGLGLAVAREILAAHGGRIEARSEPGRGTEIVMRLPARREG